MEERKEMVGTDEAVGKVIFQDRGNEKVLGRVTAASTEGTGKG
jgi:hypothetical protein